MFSILQSIPLLLFSLTYVRALAGDTQCLRAICITAAVNDTSTVTYSVTIQKPNIGWAGVVFGKTMVNNPMVVLYKNSSGLLAVSQRQTKEYILPEVDPNPPFTAVAYQPLMSFTTTESVLAFTAPAPSDKLISIGLAYSPTPPNSAGQLDYHGDGGGTAVLQLDLSKGDAGADNEFDPEGLPLTDNQRIIAAHGIIMSIVFMMILPFGSLLARFARTYTNHWFFGHWVLQFAIAGPLFLVAWILAVYEVGAVGKPHFSTGHRQWGLAFFFLYLLQVSLGAIIHFIKPKRAARRPIQNYFHALLGLGIIAAAFYQIYTGAFLAWPSVSGRAPPNGFYLFWAIWVILMPVAYSLGLALLPRQFTQERKARENKLVPLQAVYRHNAYRDSGGFGQDDKVPVP